MKRVALCLLPLAVALLCITHAAGQTSQPSVLGSSPELLLSGNPEALWIARVQQRTTRLFRRTAADPFDLGRPFRGRVVRLTTMGRDLLAFLDDGTPYRYQARGYEPIPERILPDSAVPLDLFGRQDEAYALIAPKVADQLAERSRRQNAPPAIAHYDLREWRLIGDCPPATADADDVRLAWAQDRVIVIWRSGDTIRLAHRPTSNEGSWSTPYTLPLKQPVDRMFVAWANAVVTIVAVSDDHELPEVYRLLDSIAAKGNDAWRRGEVTWSKLPEDIISATYLNATGFNQNVAVLTASEKGPLIRFAAIDSELVQDTVDIEAVLSEPAAQDMAQRLFVSLTLLLLLFVLIGLFAFRRESMVQPVTLPDGYGLAPVSARMLGFLIDFVPFSVAAGVMLDIPFSKAMQTLFAWGFSPEQNEMVNDSNLLLWWGLSVGGYAVYSLVMELITARTVGKVLTGTRVFSEDGQSPGTMQIVVRNVMRGLELLPHFWVFGLLVVLSRNQQRLGDVFARTFVARRTPLLVILDDRDDDEESSSA